MGYFSPWKIITKLVYLAAWLTMKPRGKFKLLTREIVLRQLPVIAGTGAGQFGVFNFFDSLVTHLCQPAFERLGFGRRDGLDDAEQAFGVGAVGLALFAVGSLQCKGVQVVPQLASSSGSRLRIFLMYCRGSAESVNTPTTSTMANHHSSLCQTRRMVVSWKTAIWCPRLTTISAL